MGERDFAAAEIDGKGLVGPTEVLTQHPIFWFDDAFLLLQVETTLFRVHYSLLARLSPFFKELSTLDVGELPPGVKLPLPSSLIDTRLRYAGVDRGVSRADMEVLLGYIYHDITLAIETPFLQIDSILRITGPTQLDFPRLHELVRRLFQVTFPLGMTSTPHHDHLGRALRLASQFNLISVQKSILYFLVTMNAMNPPNSTSDTSTLDDAHNEISKNEASRCSHLMTCLIEHFTPTLFTPATTPHMKCTDIFADTWMPLVIQPALEDDGVYKPIETLERMKSINWVKEGICIACHEAKREEWTKEQEGVWEAMDEWLKLN
ncbi:hypothetical protein BD779DRAFT_1438966 [Infundibulicybe gibba]|nr:hypothetical protein BD779DRAFT_1438966 [Infundibulicybe gibba]